MVCDKISKHHPEEIFHHNKLKDYIINWDNINIPAGNRDIDRLETNNTGLISINVYEPDDLLNEEKIIKTRSTKVRDAKYHIDLLKIYDEKDRSHYVLVKRLSRLLNCQSNSNTKEQHYCKYCCHPFTHERGLDAHYENGCEVFEGQKIKLPNKGDYIEFNRHNTKLKCPYVIYGDFECLTVITRDGIKGTYQEHKPCIYMLNVVNSIDNISTPYLYRGDDCMDKFVEQLAKI